MGQFVSQGFKSSIISSGGAVQSLICIINIDSMDLGLAGCSLSVPSGSLSCGEVFVKTAFMFLKLQDLRPGFLSGEHWSLSEHTHTYTHRHLCRCKVNFSSSFPLFFGEGEQILFRIRCSARQKAIPAEISCSESYEYAKKIAITSAAGESHSDLL